MQIKEYLEIVINQIKYKPIRNEIAEELKNHIEEIKDEEMQDGLSDEESEKIAIERMGDAESIGKKLNKIHKPRLDWKLLFIVVLLMCFGGLIIFTKMKTMGHYVLGKYIKALILGGILGCGIYFIDYRKIVSKPNLIYLIATFLAITTILFGDTIRGVKAYWISGSIYMPSILIPLYIISFIGFLQKIDRNKKISISINSKININFNTDLIKIIFLSILSLFLLESMNKFIPVMILCISYLVIATFEIIYIKEHKKKYLLILYGCVSAVVLIFIISFGSWYGDYLINKIVYSIRPELDSHGNGWMGVQRQIILDSSNFIGEANDMSYSIELFDEGTNFAFISILAHYGWFVCIAMIICIIAFCVKLIRNAMKINDKLGKLLVIGLSTSFILECIFNLFMNLNIGLQSDFYLPFISYGNYQLIVDMACLGLIFSVYRRKDIIFNNEKSK